MGPSVAVRATATQAAARPLQCGRRCEPGARPRGRRWEVAATDGRKRLRPEVAATERRGAAATGAVRRSHRATCARRAATEAGRRATTSTRPPPPQLARSSSSAAAARLHWAARARPRSPRAAEPPSVAAAWARMRCHRRGEERRGEERSRRRPAGENQPSATQLRRGDACNPTTCSGLQPHASQAAIPHGGGCNPAMCAGGRCHPMRPRLLSPHVAPPCA